MEQTLSFEVIFTLCKPYRPSMLTTVAVGQSAGSGFEEDLNGEFDGSRAGCPSNKGYIENAGGNTSRMPLP